EIIAASAVVPAASPICSPEKCNVSPSHVPIVTYHAPQTKYWRNIIADSFNRTDDDICGLSQGKLRPPRFHGWLREDHAGQHVHGRLQALVHRGQRVLVLDAHDVVVSRQTQCADDALPFQFVVAPTDAAEEPRALRHAAISLGVDDAVDGDVLRIERDVLRMDMEDRVAEGA